MKKMIVFMLLLASFVCVGVLKKQNETIFALDGVQKVCFVSDEKYPNLEFSTCGDMFFNFCTLQEAQQNLKEFSQKAQAVQLYFENIDLQSLLKSLKASKVSTTEIDHLNVIVAYTPFFDDCILINGKKVNLQIAEKDGKLIAGFPAILTGF